MATGPVPTRSCALMTASSVFIGEEILVSTSDIHPTNAMPVIARAVRAIK
jgi:hypothetical protein